MLRTILGLLIGAGLIISVLSSDEDSPIKLADEHVSSKLITPPQIPPNTQVVEPVVVFKENLPVKTAKRGDSYIAECDKKIKSANLNKSDTDDILNSPERLTLALAESDQMESQIAHALTINTDSASESNERLKALAREYPANKLLSFDLLLSCTLAGGHCERELIDNAVALDNQNGAVWFLMATLELKNNNAELAVEALLEAARAPVYQTYWTEHFAMFEQAFSQIGAAQKIDVQSAAMGVMAAKVMPNYGPVIKFCRAAELDRAEVLDACLEMGQQLAIQKSTMLNHIIGIALQEAIYKKLQDDGKVAELVEARKAFDESRKLSTKAMALVFNNKQRMSNWLTELKDSGEFSADEYIINEAIRLSADPDFDPCKVDWD